MTGSPSGSNFDFVETEIHPGLSVIEASAGTGKTYAISHLVPRLLLDRSVSRLDEILLVTYTNDAARELSERVRRVLEKLDSDPQPDEAIQDPGISRLRAKYPSAADREIVSRALLEIDRLGVSTIHAFCQRVLQSEGTLCGWPVEPEITADVSQIVEEALYDFWLEQLGNSDAVAAVATADGWSLADCARFVKNLMAVDDPTLLPAPVPFSLVQEGLQRLPEKIKPESIDEFASILGLVSSWRNAAPEPHTRKEMIRVLREGKSGFIDTIKCISDSPEWIDARRKEEKALKASLSSCNLLTEVADILHEMQSAAWQWKIFCFQTVREQVLTKLRKNRQITYDGLITTLRDALRSKDLGPILAQRLRAQVRIALIDESQDTDARQFEIFQSLFMHPETNHRLILIGDPKQAIYEFRGADLNTYLNARKLAADTFLLDKTYRSPQPLVDAVNAIFRIPNAFMNSELEFTPSVSGLPGDVSLELDGIPEQARVRFWIVQGDQKSEYSNQDKRLNLIAETVGTEIVRLLSANARIVHSENPESSRNVRPGDIAVLVSNHCEADAMLVALRSRGVPAIQAKREDVMLSDEAAELLILLRALEQPRHSGLRRAATATRLLGGNADTILATDRNPTLADAELEKFVCWQRTFYHHGISAALAQIDREELVLLRLAGLRDGERGITNLRQLTDLLQTATQEIGNLPGRLLAWFGQEIARATERTDVDERQQQLETDAMAVQIVTMHAAKGLEYNFVFCPFLWSSKANRPDPVVKLSSPDGAVTFANTGLAPISPDRAQAVIERSLEDRLRLAYVAITRAKVGVWIFAGDCSGNRSGASALDWLLRSNTTESFAEWLESASATGRGLRHSNAVELLMQSVSGGVISQSEPPPIGSERWQPPLESARPVLSALPPPAVPDPWGITSFSALTREKHRHADNLPIGIPSINGHAGPAVGSGFLHAPGGARMGTAIHDWLESWDFTSLDRPALEGHLKRYQLPGSGSESTHALAQSVAEMLAELRESQLPGLDCSVAEACSDAGASEWHFHLPIDRSLSPKLLASAFSEFGVGPAKQYASDLDALTVDELQGYLQGFLDRLAVHGGRWGVIDWKTNRLGDSLDAYEPDSLMRCARQSHYLLQAHLYLVALRRYLGPDASIAGAWLIFLRGVSPGTANGVLHVSPSAEFLDALDGLFFRS